MNNQKLGSNFEEYLATYLANQGYWVHFLKANKNGQPADLIVVKGGIADLIDCKTCNKRGLALSRIEDNQEYAMKKWRECGNGNALFACQLEEGIFMIPFFMVEYYLKDPVRSYLSYKEIVEMGTPLEDWI